MRFDYEDAMKIGRKYWRMSYLLRGLRVFTVSVVICILFGIAIVACSKSTEEVKTNSQTENEGDAATIAQDLEVSETDKIKTLTDSLGDSEELSVFNHGNQYHSQLSCLICHRRDTNSPRISLPGKNGHTPCIGCHTQQFEDKKNPICTICHTESENAKVKRFPPLRSFNVRFDHAKHLRKTNCTTCHKPLRGGVAKSIPTGARAHNTCFQCHSANAKHNLSSCSLCHKPGRKTGTRSQSAKIFAVFSHAKHKQNCTACHTVRAGAGRGKQIMLPQASMHFPRKNTKSCASCHNNKRAFGGDDFSDCKRCHKGNTFRF